MPIRRPDQSELNPIEEALEEMSPDHPRLMSIDHYLTLSLYFGIPLQRRDKSYPSYFLPNTLTSYLSVNSNECVECQQWDNNTYYANSTTANFNRETQETLDFGQFTVEGYMGSDFICWKFDYDYCTNETEFFEITSYSEFFEPPI